MSYDYLVPIVVKQTPRGERSFDIYSRLLEERIIFVGADIDDGLASSVIAQLLFLQGEDETEPINMYVMSRGGAVNAGLAIYDTMQFVRCDVSTVCVGMAASMGAVLLAAGSPEKRFILPNSRVLIHQPLIAGVLTGPATDLDIEAHELLRLRTRLYEILAQHTGQAVDQIERDCDRNKWLAAEEAVEYGCADKILQRMPQPQPGKPEEADP